MYANSDWKEIIATSNFSIFSDFPENTKMW